MEREDWDFVPIPKTLVKTLDEFLQSKNCKKYGIRTRAELVRFILQMYVDKEST